MKEEFTMEKDFTTKLQMTEAYMLLESYSIKAYYTTGDIPDDIIKVAFNQYIDAYDGELNNDVTVLNSYRIKRSEILMNCRNKEYYQNYNQFATVYVSGNYKSIWTTPNSDENGSRSELIVHKQVYDMAVHILKYHESEKRSMLLEKNYK